jgi:GT2 family glycosyltransferase
MVDLSIIIVSWNARDHLLKCLQSLQRYLPGRSVEILVVDNASTDGSQEAVRRDYPAVKLTCNEENYGFAKANNIGIAHSAGTYVCLVNSDVELIEDCFTKLIGYLELQQTVGLVGPQILDSRRAIQRSAMGFPTLWNTLCRALALDRLFPGSRMFGGLLMTYWSHDTLREVDVINGCFWVVRREALARVGLLDERFFIYAEDTDWCRRFRDDGWKVVYLPYAQAVHYGGGSSVNAPSRFYLEMQRANLQYWRKYHNLPQTYLYLGIALLHHSVRFFGEVARYAFRSEANRPVARMKISRSRLLIAWVLRTFLRTEGAPVQGRAARTA